MFSFLQEEILGRPLYMHMYVPFPLWEAERLGYMEIFNDL